MTDGLAGTMPGQPEHGAPVPVEFGRTYRNTITGFEGIATGFARYIAGCDQVLLKPKVDKDNKDTDGAWIDDVLLIDVEAERAVERTSTRGGPQSEAPSTR